MAPGDEAAPKRQQIRRRTLPAERRDEFNRRVLEGEDVNRLARRFNLEACYAKRHARRVLDRAARILPHTSRLAPAAPEREEMAPLEFACLLLGGRVRPARNGYYELDGFHAGPKEVARAANQILRSRGQREIPYPGLVPCRA